MTEIPRVETVRRQLSSTIAMLQACADEIEDLHSIAYEKNQRGLRERVKTSVDGYSLDGQGDPKARAAYRRLVGVALATCQPIDRAALDVIAILREGGPASRGGPGIVRAVEVAEAIAAQARRMARGDYTPVRSEAQPERAPDPVATVRSRGLRPERKSRPRPPWQKLPIDPRQTPHSLERADNGL